MLSIINANSSIFPLPSPASPLTPSPSLPRFSRISISTSPIYFLKSPNCFHSKPLSFLTPVSASSDSVLDDRDSIMEAASSPSGEIHVIVGPMFAGKTTALLRRLQSECHNGRRVAVIKSNKDTRYSLDSVVTHDGVKMPCWALPDLSTFGTILGADEYEKLDVIGIDEAQFFEDLYDFCCKAADHDGKTLIVAGLDGDYLRRNFGSILDIVPLADSVTKLTARCEICGKRAFFTLRKTEETQTELIGGLDIYMPVCRQHYVSGHLVIEAARNVVESRKVQRDSCLEVAAVAP